MPSDTCTASRILDKLHEHVMRIRNSVPENGHIDLHDLDSVEHVMNFDFEHLNEKAVPPLYFEPMQPVELKQFPPDPAQVRSFFDIIERGNNDSSCCRQISDLISDYATRNALSHQHLQIVEAPDSTFYLEASLAWPYSGRDSESEREELYEHEDAGEEYTNFLPMSCSAMFPDEEIFPAARAYNLTGNTLCTWPNLLSGSKVSKEQFLLYRIVCPERKKPRELDLTWFGVPHNTIADAQEMLNQSDAYRHYLHNIQNGDWANPALGVFGPALRLQAKIWKG
ncbi:hypothetical protein AnigIFM56816_004473 [Aspergillus niger]|nr:hypothetical protein AnigIFM56816_004473 [Aspergillus niger]